MACCFVSGRPYGTPPCPGCSAWPIDAGTLLLLLLPRQWSHVCCPAKMPPHLCGSFLVEHGWGCHVLSAVYMTKCELSCPADGPQVPAESGVSLSCSLCTVEPCPAAAPLEVWLPMSCGWPKPLSGPALEHKPLSVCTCCLQRRAKKHDPLQNPSIAQTSESS